MDNFPTPHSHPNSFDSAATPEAFAKKELELGSGHLTVTDHGTLEGCRSAYDLCRSDKRFAGKLNPILGLEAYVRDDSCPILEKAGVQKAMRYRNELTNQRVTQKAYEKLPKAGQQLCVPEYGYWEHLKYLHCTLHFLDQEAFFTAVKLLSKADLRAEQHGSERKPIFTWADLEELGSKNVTMTSSCLIGVVGRHLLAHNDWQTAIKYYQRVRGLVKPGNFLVEMFPHTCDQNWDSGVWVKYEDGTEEKFPVWKKFKTDAGELKAESLAQADLSKHKRILEVMQNRKWTAVETPKTMVSADLREGFVKNECKPWSPDGDVQLGVNRFILQIAQKMGDVVLCSDDSHFTSPDEKIVQDMRLAQSGGWKMANSYHRLDNDSAGAWFRDRMGISQAEFEGWVQNNHEWAARFHDFKFTTQKALPTNFYPANTLEHTAKLISKHGRLIHDAAHLGRLQQEIELLHRNGKIDLFTYFQMLEEAVDWHTRNGKITGPGRGSAAGVYLTYLFGVTHVDPIKADLSLDRFMTPVRIESGKLPDIDQDVGDRDLLDGYEEPGFKVEFEDGTFMTVPAGHVFQTDKGVLSPHKAMEVDADVTKN